ncbi:MAG: hypothetical protein OXD36_04870 [Rhodobacter sp.]|nr:hypothetical protein [Rhodobacter sp.]
MAKPIYVRNGAKALAVTAAFSLAACEDGGPGGVITHGWLPPLETAQTQNERALAILPEVDSEFISTTYSENSIPNSPRTTIRHTCAGTRAGCLAFHPTGGSEGGDPATRVPAGGELVVEGTQTPLRSKNGVTLIRTHRNTVSPAPGDTTTGRETRLGRVDGT